MKSKLLLILRIALGVGLVVFLVSRADLSQLTITIDGRAIAGLAGAVGLLLVALGLSAVRWRLVLGPHAPDFGFLTRLYLIGWFFSLFLPTSVGGDAVRAVGVTRGSIRTGQALSSIVIERLLGVAALALYLLIGFAFAPALLFGAVGDARSNFTWAQLLLAAAGAVLGLWALIRVGLRIPRVSRAIRDAAELLSGFRRSPRRLLAAVFVSLLVQAAYILVWYTLALGLRRNVSALALLVFVPLVSLAAMLPVTLSGLGVREGVWALLLAPFGVPVANAVAFSLLYYFCSLVVGIVGGAVFVLSGTKVRPHRELDVDNQSATAAPAASY